MIKWHKQGIKLGWQAILYHLKLEQDSILKVLSNHVINKKNEEDFTNASELCFFLISSTTIQKSHDVRKQQIQYNLNIETISK